MKWLVVLLALFGVILCAAMPRAAERGPGKKLIATGWDMANAERLRANLAEMERRPFDGVVLRFSGRGNRPYLSYAFTRDVWDEEPIRQITEDLKACRPERLTDNFLLVNANPGDVDWFDDEGWAIIASHWRIAARVARDGGLKGILFDPEPYRKPYRQFAYASQSGHKERSFEEYGEEARQRGREVMEAVAGEYPSIALFCYFMLSATGIAADRGDPVRALAGHTYGLLPSFIDGWLDVAPPSVTLVDGCESAYRFNSELEYLNAANRIKGVCQRLVSPENRYKYRAQVQVSFGVYLDAYINPPDSPWYIAPGGQSRVDRLRQNVETALRVADEYVWVYGEKCSWWPTPHAKANERRWPEALPGIEDALMSAADPAAFALRRLREAGDDAVNLLRNGDFSAERVRGEEGETLVWAQGRAPVGWSFWQRDDSVGEATWDREVGADALGSARLARTLEGCFLQSISVSPGERYAVVAKQRIQGRGDGAIRVRWQDADSRWYAPSLDKLLDAAGPRGEWNQVAGVVTVPEGAARLVLLLLASGQQSDNDALWYDDVVVLKLD